jgi:hypothetical protein
MANVINNTDLDKVAQTVANGKKDKQTLRKPIKLQGITSPVCLYLICYILL